MTREQFEVIRPLLESARKKTKPREVDLYYVFNAVLYLLKTGCQKSILSGEPLTPNKHKICWNRC